MNNIYCMKHELSLQNSIFHVNINRIPINIGLLHTSFSVSVFCINLTKSSSHQTSAIFFQKKWRNDLTSAFLLPHFLTRPLPQCLHRVLCLQSPQLCCTTVDTSLFLCCLLLQLYRLYRQSQQRRFEYLYSKSRSNSDDEVSILLSTIKRRKRRRQWS